MHLHLSVVLLLNKARVDFSNFKAGFRNEKQVQVIFDHGDLTIGKED